MTSARDRNLCGVCRGIYIPRDALMCKACARLHPRDERPWRKAEGDQVGDDFSPRGPSEA